MFNIDKWHITENGVNEGLANRLFPRSGAIDKAKAGDIRWNSIQNLSMQLGCDQEYARLLSDVSVQAI